MPVTTNRSFYFVDGPWAGETVTVEHMGANTYVVTDPQGNLIRYALIRETGRAEVING